MAPTVFITGGARSGKSAFAQQRAESHPGSLLYLAAARSEDAEMAARIQAHQEARGPRWRTVEEPLDIPGALREARGCEAVLFDCVTLWLSNLLFHHREDQAAVLAAVDGLVAILPRLEAPLYLVSNEVGSGIVPENRLARLFRDLAGTANQRLAAAADEAWLVAAGCPLRLK
ncbi:bifunctional adenosylcobinamide kinase/adenosylcobinamide-phosphate guanylyltransferase [Geoalkalibacter halelectricus]|uniref:Adenosylcobinamide kinase n=1 Tax=Geoalkalibacter halelectricus TaxID=2847045 RepID=A0ABY5ZS55_9BACT|nr:bifunctional adenosylcobinamide kinase/adenosylcobinamide-phosphate guanylyltransferase [Geoalkalibacter halelectricus]MDO3377515.1 bifunctional adenosylcobinamide kinase/adenosylcobinamide-phosphate guanylyltransferase [Geoalkalibacter halelectricus]UWZ80725.1 bifunctional adenosylcobinamide kinase/adenosylcobinamide-phosphate guanylyltransferase [Geoalkalibacter halelectricus]